MNVLILAFAFELQYSVVRCARMAGHTVHVLGSGYARGLRYSLSCRSYRQLESVPGEARIDEIVTEVEMWIRTLRVDAILPSDALSTRFLSAVASRLTVPTCLLPDPASFDRLNDKAHFALLCQACGVSTPDTALFDSPAAVSAAIAQKRLHLPLVVKPRDGMAGEGVLVLRTVADFDRLARCAYHPLLVQAFIEGRDRDISLLARDGEIIAYAVQHRDAATFDFTDNLQLLTQVRRLIAAEKFTGVAHFDARETKDGSFYLIECNPRFWYSIFALAAAGLNMVDLSLQPAYAKNASVRTASVTTGIPLLLSLFRNRWPASARWMARYYAGDPIGWVCDRGRFFDDARPGAGGIDAQIERLRRLVSETARSPFPNAAAMLNAGMNGPMP